MYVCICVYMIRVFYICICVYIIYVCIIYMNSIYRTYICVCVCTYIRKGLPALHSPPHPPEVKTDSSLPHVDAVTPPCAHVSLHSLTKLGLCYPQLPTACRSRRMCQGQMTQLYLTRLNGCTEFQARRL